MESITIVLYGKEEILSKHKHEFFQSVTSTIQGIMYVVFTFECTKWEESPYYNLYQTLASLVEKEKEINMEMCRVEKNSSISCMYVGKDVKHLLTVKKGVMEVNLN